MDIQSFFDYNDDLFLRWINRDKQLINDNPFLRFQKANAGLLKEAYFNTMPEPFWGNPENCSVVMINLNPAFKKGHDVLFSREKARQLCPDGYSHFAKRFPIMDRDSYNPEGRKWWDGRNKYLVRLAEAYPRIKKGIQNLRPFVVELCPWQTGNWHETRIRLDGNSSLLDHIDEYVIMPALHAVENSAVDFAVTIGKPILDALLECGFTIDKRWGPGLGSTVLPGYPMTLKKGDAEKTPAEVFFTLLTRKESDKTLKVLCIRKSGSNNVPGPEYMRNGIERSILEYISKV